ncbi:MAG: hypothetical protein AB7V55_00975 [Oscillospiraceae bacterium]
MRRRYRNVAFLAELLINILVFSVSCAVLVGLFGKAGQIAAGTREETFAGTEVQSLLETVKARGTEGLAHGVPQPDGSVLCFYDAEWNPTGQDDARYQVRLALQPEETAAGVLNHLSAVAQDAAGREICRVQTANYHPAGGDGA